jgi:hypothetical protein
LLNGVCSWFHRSNPFVGPPSLKTSPFKGHWRSMTGSRMHIIDDAYHDCHLSTSTLCLTVTWKLKFFGELSLGGAMFGDQRHVLSLRDYVETYSFVVPPHIPCLWLFSPVSCCYYQCLCQCFYLTLAMYLCGLPR